MLLKVVSLIMLSSMSLFACPGGEPVELNDNCKLYAWMISCGENGVDGELRFSKEEILKGKDNDIQVRDSNDKFTHRVLVEHDEEQYAPIITVRDSAKTETRYVGQYGQKRGGCNELKKIE